MADRKSANSEKASRVQAMRHEALAYQVSSGPQMNDSQILISRTEAMRLEAVRSQIESGGAGDSPFVAGALMGELDCMVELEILKQQKGEKKCVSKL